jgi:2-methylcitrate dehydratase PrpD
MTSLMPSRGIATTPTIADLVSTLGYAPVSAAARASARIRLADTIFATGIGLGTEQGRRSSALADSLYGRQTLAGRAFRLCAGVRMTEIDDVDLTSCITPGSIVVSTVLAVLSVAADDISLERVLDTTVRGYELALGLGEAMQGPHRLASGVWPTLAAGGVVAAVVTSLLLGATPEDAAKLAATQSVHANPRGNARETLLATAVVTGIASALAVQHGFSIAGSDQGPLGRLLVQPVALDSSAPRILRPAMKAFCSARQVMTAVCALRAIQAEFPLRPDDVERIEVSVPSAYAAMIDKPSVGTRRESLASAQYQLALQVCEPAALQDVGRETLRTDADFRAVMATIHVQSDPTLSALYPAQWPAQLRLISGTGTYYGSVDAVPGEQESTVEAFTAKVGQFARSPAHDLAQRALDATSTADLLDLIAAIDRGPWERSV